MTSIFHLRGLISCRRHFGKCGSGQDGRQSTRLALSNKLGLSLKQDNHTQGYLRVINMELSDTQLGLTMNCTICSPVQPLNSTEMECTQPTCTQCQLAQLMVIFSKNNFKITSENQETHLLSWQVVSLPQVNQTFL